MQLLELVAPVLLEYRPTPQAMQLLELSLEYRPAVHWSVQLLAPVLLLEYRPASQPMQPPSSLALDGWYRPARQR